ncbi:MAG: thioredoxin family protein [Bacillota bacterium]
MLVLDKDNFEAEVLSAKGSVVVDFWSPKCEPCMELMPEIVALSEKYGSQVKFGKVDVSQNRRLAISQKVLGLPTIVLYKDGEKVAELTKDFVVDDVEGKIKELL